MENNTDLPESNNFTPLSVQEVDVDFLPIVYEIIRRYLHVDLIFSLSRFRYYVVYNITFLIV